MFSLHRATFSHDDATMGRFLHPVVRVFVSGHHAHGATGDYHRSPHGHVLRMARRRAEGELFGIRHDDREDTAWQKGDRDKPAAATSFPPPVSDAPLLVAEVHVSEDFNAEFVHMEPYGMQIARAIHAGVSTLVKSAAAARVGEAGTAPAATKIVQDILSNELRRQLLPLLDSGAEQTGGNAASSGVGVPEASSGRTPLMDAGPLGVMPGLATANDASLFLAGALRDGFAPRHPASSRAAAYDASRSVGAVLRRSM